MLDRIIAALQSVFDIFPSPDNTQLPTPNPTAKGGSVGLPIRDEAAGGEKLPQLLLQSCGCRGRSVAS